MITPCIPCRAPLTAEGVLPPQGIAAAAAATLDACVPLTITLGTCGLPRVGAPRVGARTPRL
eukprot:scaffold15564_cov33-Phaeocystis_antarctica.AAC.1